MVEFAKCSDRKCKHWPRNHAHPISDEHAALTNPSTAPDWLRDKLRTTLTEERTSIFLALCGKRPGGMAANQVDLLINLALHQLSPPPSHDREAG